MLTLVIKTCVSVAVGEGVHALPVLLLLGVEITHICAAVVIGHLSLSGTTDPVLQFSSCAAAAERHQKQQQRCKF